ncbi:MAG: proteasome-activating nucleotidase [Methanosarcinales archaeon]|nr:proteasome-activating nucleotidase [ANME-2 cluster archaeon]MDF1531739.1 proteasome-activating nucleotidase [ANME-2 cluster archaeon]MDW7776639.1 proteasome-activating nucleotidase [Methanosarcinales archaeon]
MDNTVAQSSNKPDFVNSQKLDTDNDIAILKKKLKQAEEQNNQLQTRLLDAAVANSSYLQNIHKLKEQLEELKRPPLFIASVMEVLDDTALLRQHGSNQEVLIDIPLEMAGELQAGMRVAVNNGFGIVSFLSKPADMRARVMELIEAPDTDYNSIGGLDDEIKEVIETIELPLTDPQMFIDVGIEPPKGILLYGPPGSGKTLIAKAVAHRAHATFIRMSGSELVQKYVGEGARLVRDVFQMAKDKSPSIVFIDEIDAVGGRRTHDGTTGSAEVNRTMIQLLAELDGFEERGDVKIIAATNRIDLLDPALLRPGRFDRIIEIPMPDEKGRLEIFKIHTRNMALDENVDFDKLVKLTEDLSGADIKAIVTEAGMFVIRRRDRKIMMNDFIDAYHKIIVEEKEDAPSGMFV